MADPMTDNPDSGGKAAYNRRQQKRLYKQIYGDIEKQTRGFNSAINQLVNNIGAGGTSSKSLAGAMSQVNNLFNAFAGSKGIGGATAATAKYSGGVAGATSNLNVWVAALKVAIVTVARVADEIDKLEKIQAKLQRSHGGANLTLGLPYRLQAIGYRAAGSEGAKAAEELGSILLEQRKGLYEGTTKAQFERLTKMTVGMDEATPAVFKALTQQFGMGVGPNATAAATLQIEKMQKAAMLAKLPMEQYRSLIMGLADEFAFLGQNVADAQATMTVVGATLKAGVNEAAVRSFASQITSERLTSGGVPQSILTAVMAKRTFGGLSQGTQNQLNDLAKKTYGVPFSSLGTLQATNITTSNDLSREAYVDLKRNQLNYMEQRIARVGGPTVARAISPEFMGGEYENLRKVIRAAETGASLTALRQMEAATTVAEGGMGDMKYKQAIDDQYRDLMNKNADLWKEWYSEFSALWKDVMASLADFASAIKYGAKTPEQAALVKIANQSLISGLSGGPNLGTALFGTPDTNTVELPAGRFKIEYIGPPQGANPANATTVTNNNSGTFHSRNQP